jgi:magnesium transporter
MARLKLPKRRTLPGTSPGTLVPDPGLPRPIIRLISYDAVQLEEAELTSPQQVTQYLGKGRTVWIDVDGLGHAPTLAELGAVFNIHALALEDVVNTHQRPKMESYGGLMFVVARMVAAPDGETEQVSLFLGPGFVISFNERERDCFDPVRRRLREHLGRVRERGADYLLYTLLDAIVDSFFPRLDTMGELLEDLESEVLSAPSPRQLGHIHELRHELFGIRRIMSATREAVNAVIRDTGDEISESTRVYLRDCYDHSVQLIDIVESQREIATGLMEIYLSSVSNRMNKVMKVLTIMSTVFIPLTFIVGLYGMNFNTERSPWNMPELNWAYGYPAIMALMVLIVLVELWIFWRKGWLWEERRDAGRSIGGK